MTIELSSLTLQNTGDVATDVEVSMSTFDELIHDGVWIKFYRSNTGDFTGEEERLPESADVGLFPDDGYSSEVIRARGLVSDAENFIKAEAESINWEESSTYNDAFDSEGFTQSYNDAGQPGSSFDGVPPS